jgi:hypothetical protein
MTTILRPPVMPEFHARDARRSVDSLADRLDSKLPGRNFQGAFWKPMLPRVAALALNLFALGELRALFRSA